MSAVVEIEISYLAATIPKGLAQCEHFDIEDVYFPSTADRPYARIRKKGSTYEFTKKVVIDPNDAGQLEEYSIGLTAEEYQALAKGDGRTVSKTRYLLPYNGRTAEVDVFTGDLAGLVIIEFEFKDIPERDSFKMPEFCLADVTQEKFIAGGTLAGKSYQDIQNDLDRYDYRPLQA